MFVMLDNDSIRRTAKKGESKCVPVKYVNLGGKFRNVPTDEAAQETKGGGLDNKEYAQMKRTTRFICTRPA
jgi:hypothetical protein